MPRTTSSIEVEENDHGSQKVDHVAASTRCEPKQSGGTTEALQESATQDSECKESRGGVAQIPHLGICAQSRTSHSDSTAGSRGTLQRQPDMAWHWTMNVMSMGRTDKLHMGCRQYEHIPGDRVQPAPVGTS